MSFISSAFFTISYEFAKLAEKKNVEHLEIIM